MSGKFVCIHAHFYQPPRENPWIDEVETEESAAPFHDWNVRITRECYGPNTASRILEGGKIQRIVNNYEKISFNFGPTLLSWMERREPEVYGKILSADKASVKERNGHGNAIAQVYNHSIMPLNSARDKETQIVWGIRDFKHRFGRQPEGIWLAETAVDRESLLIAAKHGIKFTILAPHQAKRVWPLKPSDKWTAEEKELDSSMPYLYRPDDETEIAIFFYDGALSHSIAFDGALDDGKKLGDSIMAAFKKEKKRSRLVHIATDGESYGHHHRFGEMALSAALKVMEDAKEITLTNYGEYLANNPPTMEVDIHDNSSWSCAHGVERWREDCGCNTGGQAGWNQKWRKPLRNSLDDLKERLDNLFEEGIRHFVKSPWTARNDYINLLADRNEESINSFFEKHASRKLQRHQRTEALKYLEMQVSAMKMFTSCGWFFNDIAGLETVQILKYSARAIDLAQQLSLLQLEGRFLEGLSQAESNIKENATGMDIYESFVRPLKMDPKQLAAHKLIINALQRDDETKCRIFSYELELLDRHLEEYLDTMLMVGRLRLTCSATLEVQDLVFCLLHFGGHDVNCAFKLFLSTDIYEAVRDKLLLNFRKRSMPDMIRAVEEHFGTKYYTVKALFKDERKKVVKQLLTERIKSFGEAYQELFEKNSKLMDFFADVNVPMPEEFIIAAKYVFEKRLNALFASAGNGDDAKIMTRTIKEADKWGIRLNYETLEQNAGKFLEQNLIKARDEQDAASAKIIVETMRRMKRHNIEINLWEMQNIIYPFFIAMQEKADKLYGLAKSSADFAELFRAFGFAPLPTFQTDVTL